MKPPLLPRVQAGALIASGVLRAAGEMVEIVAGQHTPLSGLVSALSLAAFALGVTGIWHEARNSLSGRIATPATIAGALGFVLVALHASLVLGAPPAGEVAAGLPYIASGLVTFVGVTALAWWILRSPRYPGWIGLVLIATVANSLLASFLALPPIVQPLFDMVMAVSFVQFGLSMYENARHNQASQGPDRTP